MPTRFVILHHAAPDGEHWDLMLEHGGVLRTWQLPREPAGPEALPLPARRIGDHRLAYLTYEGPLTNGRGRVTRVDEGTCSMVENAEGGLLIHLAGRRLRGSFLLAPTAHGSHDWQLEPADGA